jgi:glycosyltransferase involved in cell wall biosynthesis
VLRLALVTLADHERRTGGNLYQQRMAEEAPAHGASIQFAPIRSHAWPLGAAGAAGKLRQGSDVADVILLDSIAAALAAPWIGRVRAPVVGVVHQRPGGVDHGPIRSAAQRSLDRRAYRRSGGLIATGESLVDDLRMCGVAADRIRIVPPGSDAPVAEGPTLDLRRGRATAILCVANWSPSKGVRELLDAFAALPENAATLWLVGDAGSDRAYARRVHRRIAAPDLRRRVVVCGALAPEEVGRMYRSADVFALCSYVESYGAAWAEAIAAGLPVVGWRTAGLPSLVADGREALMPKPGDQRGLAAALLTVTTDPLTRERLAARVRERATSLPTWRRSAERFFNAVRELSMPPVRSRRPPPPS